jgi:hypothetical protein
MQRLTPVLLLAFLCGPALPGRQALRHRHAGDGHAHRHSDATVRAHVAPPAPAATHHHHPHGHSHPPHVHDDHGHASPALAPVGADTRADVLSAGDGQHTHWSAPLQRLHPAGGAAPSIHQDATASPAPTSHTAPTRHVRPAHARGPPSSLLA